MATTTDTTTRHDTATPADPMYAGTDIRAHERTFEGFVKFLAWNAVGIIVILVFLALANA